MRSISIHRVSVLLKSCPPKYFFSFLEIRIILGGEEVSVPEFGPASIVVKQTGASAGQGSNGAPGTERPLPKEAVDWNMHVSKRENGEGRNR